MISDLHIHILPGVDDGPRDLDEALTLAGQAVAAGVVRVCSGVHSRWPGRESDPKRLSDALACLRDGLRREGLALEVAEGMECLLDPDLPARVERGEVLTLAGSRYLGVELPPGVDLAAAGRVLFNLSLVGVVPVILHPERAERVAAEPGSLRSLVEQGALVAVAAPSLLGPASVRRAAEGLLRLGLVDALVSDAHRPDSRPVRLAEALGAAARVVGKARAERLVRDLPACVWADREYTGGTQGCDPDRGRGPA
ncbi:MAG: hypothetical protein K6U08_05680 [Firmicutes bacterium]|nr:hypothetical protein [Bacillota bacterium]